MKRHSKFCSFSIHIDQLTYEKLSSNMQMSSEAKQAIVSNVERYFLLLSLSLSLSHTHSKQSIKMNEFE